jgi:hypothetical protein
VPEPLIYVVVGVAVVTLGFIGYGCGLGGSRRFVSTALVAVLIAAVLSITVDLDRLRRASSRSARTAWWG